MSSQYFRFSARAMPELRRAALLERLLARADGFETVANWRADAFRVVAPDASMPAIASAALFASQGAVEAGWVCLATPVHYVADMTSVRLPQDGILSMQYAAGAMLAEDFNRVWKGSGCRLIAGGSAHLYCAFDETLEVATRDPEEALGQYIEEYLPLGASAPQLRRLMSEIEMWLFEHQVNRAREASSLPRINGLWLWGGGTPVAALPEIAGRIAGDDVFFNAFSSRTGQKNDGAVIIAPAVPGTEGWSDTEHRWLKPALAQLRAGTLSRLEISAGLRRFTLTRRAAWRFWRRSTPWWESFA